MTELFINTEDKLEPNEVSYGEVLGPDGYKQIAVRCVRKATLEEYINFVKGHNLTHMVHRTINDKNFYLVEVLD